VTISCEEELVPPRMRDTAARLMSSFATTTWSGAAPGNLDTL